MMTKKISIMGVAALASAFFSGSAIAQVSFSANAAMTSDYVFRGYTQSDRGVSVSGGVDMSSDNGFYAGIWGTTIDFGGSNSPDLEVDLYAGKTGTLGSGSTNYDIGLIYYWYPDYDKPAGGADINFLELKAGLEKAVSEQLSLSGTVYVSPDFFGETGLGVNTEIGAGYGFTEVASVDGSLGYQTADDIEDYLHGNLGVTLSKNGVSLDIRGHMTDVENDRFASERVAATLSFEFGG